MTNRTSRQTLLFLIASAMMLLCSCTLMKPSYRGEDIVLNSYPYQNAETRPMVVATYRPAFGLQSSPQTAQLGTRVVKLADVRPVRDHGGVWSDEAMRYDLNAMQACGLNGCLLMLRPSELIDTHYLERIRQFFSMCAMCRPVFQVGLFLYSDTPIDMGTGNVAQFLSQNGFAALPAALSTTPDARKMLVVFDTSCIHLNWQHFAEERQFIMKPWNRNMVVLPDNTAMMLCGGNCGLETEVTNSAQHRWPIPRGDGSFLANALRRAFMSHAPLICIHSWNWFRDGSFISANTLDGTLLANILREELDKLEELRLQMQMTDTNSQ